MKSPAHALRLVLENAAQPRKKFVPLANAGGFVLAQKICAPRPVPLADNSAMDGYAFNSLDTVQARRIHPCQIEIKGTLKAGDPPARECLRGSAYRIMTGAFMPQGADTVIAQEDAVVRGGKLYFSETMTAGTHIRKRGEEVKKGQTLLAAGTAMDPAAMGIAAGCGCRNVYVYDRPRVTVLATGSELIRPGQILKTGKIYDSNSWLLRAALLEMGIRPAEVKLVRDDLRAMRKALRKPLRVCDFVLIAGGVSSGDYDVVKEALRLEGVQTIFWKVNQKPGKPLYFGSKSKTAVFGLPGNPAAVFTCFYKYVYPALRKSSGLRNPLLLSSRVLADAQISQDSKRFLFCKAKLNLRKGSATPKAEILSRQGSHMLTSLMEADGFLEIPPTVSGTAAPEIFRFERLPWR